MSLFTSKLRHKVIALEKSRADDGAGGFDTSWQTALTVWAEIFHKASAEKYLGGQLAPNSTLVFRVRYTNAITTDMRLSYNGKIFAITALHNLREEGKVLDILAVEEVA